MKAVVSKVNSTCHRAYQGHPHSVVHVHTHINPKSPKSGLLPLLFHSQILNATQIHLYFIFQTRHKDCNCPLPLHDSMVSSVSLVSISWGSPSIVARGVGDSKLLPVLQGSREGGSNNDRGGVSRSGRVERFGRVIDVFEAETHL
ncbi:hypothetical protein CEXT_807711 [Caerostris extrusa]|uniref:Uncharacterized protein n=1 Tax=Caerostris extrusa TaxID=172846 RepID=A0AAV4V6I4_CAEEX|nr:hypothetical protein CEXT_807711 [Caerostris extrusa]